jgi:ankyrin repeat protein
MSSSNDLLKLAIYSNDLLSAKQALEAGADPNTRIREESKYNGFSLLHLAAVRFESLSMMKLLFNYKANPNNSHGNIPLLAYAIVYGSHTEKNYKIIEFLVDNGADPLQKYKLKDFESTPLYATKYIEKRINAKFGAKIRKLLEKKVQKEMKAAKTKSASSTLVEVVISSKPLSKPKSKSKSKPKTKTSSKSKSKKTSAKKKTKKSKK